MPDTQIQARAQVSIAPATIGQPAFDQARSEAFMGTMIGFMNGAAVSMMAAIGHKTRLFDAMAALPGPATSQQVADAAKLDERYVREWLAVMVTGGVVEYDAAACAYRLPAEHAFFLTDANGANLAVTAQLLPVATRAMDRVVECFHTGGGTHYHDYPCFHSAMAEESAQSVVAHLFTAILPLVPGLEARLERGITVMDAGCGQGRALLAMAGRFPNSRFVGLDLCEDALDAGWRLARERNLTNVFFEARDLSDFTEPETYDLVTSFDAVHDQKDPAGMLRGIACSLKPGGTYLMQDIGGSSFLERNLDHPLGPLLYAMSTLHCMPVSLGQGGVGLGTMWGVELAENMLKEAGFRDITCHRLDHDPVNAYFVSRI